MNERDAFQNLLNNMMNEWKVERQESQITFGKLIGILQSFYDSGKKDTIVQFSNGSYPAEGGSYRGYYTDYAFNETHEPITVDKLICLCKLTVGKELEGYKGGQFLMDYDTPLWKSPYGICTQIAIADFAFSDNKLILITKERNY